MTKDVDFKPSDIRLESIPLINTYHKVEIELTAAMMVHACVELYSDQWAEVSIHKLSELLKRDFEARRLPYYHWMTNPFVRPNPALMVERGYAALLGSSDSPSIVFTELGKAKLQQWVRI